jgi:putative endonuclease
MQKRPSQRKALGDWGERTAAEYLERHGYRILDTNYRCTWGEVDLIAQQCDCLVFVEVRTRRGDAFGTPAESVTSQKQERLVATAETYVQALESPPPEWRIDLITITISGKKKAPRLEHLPNAIELP